MNIAVFLSPFILHSTAVDAVDWLGHAVFLSVHAVFLSPLNINSIIKNNYPLIIK
jgi:hypothetical protein